jgi:hypothetical protein
MNIRYLALIMPVLLLVLLGGCVPSANGKQATTGTAAASASRPVMIVNGEEILAADLIAFPSIRNPLRAYIYRVSLAQEVKRRGVAVAEDKMKERVEAEKQLASSREQTWEEYLADMNYTEEEFIAEAKDELLLDELVALDVIQ